MISSRVFAKDAVIRYLDIESAPSSKERSLFYIKFVKVQQGYEATSYWTSTNSIHGHTFYPDALLSSPIVLYKTYYKNGNPEDPIFDTSNGARSERSHFYSNKQLGGHAYGNISGKEVVEGFDESGKKIKNYVFEREAEFKDGHKARISYLIKHIRKDLVTTGKEPGQLLVAVRLVVGPNGYIIRIQLEKSSGPKDIDSDVTSVISAIPKGNNAIQLSGSCLLHTANYICP